MKCYDEYASEYDAWFLKNSNLLMSEVKLVAEALEASGDVLSVGCGSGLMEAIMKREFDITVEDGVEPSPGMRAIAEKRGMHVIAASAEDFPIAKKYDTVLMNGCPSYIADLDHAFAHAAEALKPNGQLVVCDVPKESAYALVYNLAMTLGTWDHPLLEGVKPPDPYPIAFVKSAHWRTTEEKVAALKRCGFLDFTFMETLTMHPNASNDTIEEPSYGHTTGSYVAIIAKRVPFLDQLKAGTLPKAAFESYLAQDAYYLKRHAETLKMLAEKLEKPEEKALFLKYAADGVAAEEAMQREYLAGVKVPDVGWGKKTLEYVKECAAPVAVAAVYPCFRLYADAGRWLKGAEGPYARWIATYASADFAEAADRVEAVLKRLLHENGEYQYAMEDAERESTQEELDYWNSCL